MTVRTAVSVEMLCFPAQSSRADRFFTALAQTATAAGIHVTPTPQYHGGSDLLLLWGPGAPDRVEPMREQVAAGGHVVCCDLAYWQRETKVRVSIDAAHPQRWVMRRDWPARRLLADGITMANAWDPTGPVLIAGIGAKATVQYGAGVAQWEADMAVQAKRRGFEVRYRAKRPPGIPIADALQGVSLLITWHSNVAVDAIRLGIPVICRDGAAAAVCPSTWMTETVPLAPEIRDRFLANLAFFQWAPSEASACWAFLTELLA